MTLFIEDLVTEASGRNPEKSAIQEKAAKQPRGVDEGGKGPTAVKENAARCFLCSKSFK
jgi:hypothetical protein